MDKTKSMISCPENLGGLQKQWKVFLVGPIQGSQKWQYNLPEIPGVTWINPRRPSYPVPNFDYNQQVRWETDGLRMANLILCWIPEPSEDVAGRSYAQTTRFELGENIARGKKIILGAYNDFPGRKYLVYKAEQNSNVDGVYSSIEDCLEALKNYIDSREEKIWFTSDTHFSSDRTLNLSCRPFSGTDEMDWTMIERWNNVVGPKDKVYHLGDFGENWPLDYLTGDIKFIPGNYEKEGKSSIDSSKVEVLGEITKLNLDNHNFVLSHEPLLAKGTQKDNEFCLFGHIHGRQMIKKFGGLDVGVDCNNFTPVSLNKVLFYKNAIEKGYYDDEVFC